MQGSNVSTSYRPHSRCIPHTHTADEIMISLVSVLLKRALCIAPRSR